MPIGVGTLLAVAGAVVALGVAGFSTVIGVRAAGVAGAAAVAENKENFKSSLVLQSLPQTQTVYAFITALFIIMGAGLLTANGQEITMFEGLVMFGAALIVALTAITAIFQGTIAAAGIASCAKNSEAFVPNIVFTGQAETPAIFGFITALIILVVGLGVLG